MAREYHVAKHGNDKNTGTYESPFLTISKAAKLADEGDTVIVHEGEYREWVFVRIPLFHGHLQDGFSSFHNPGNAPVLLRFQIRTCNPSSHNYKFFYLYYFYYP